MKTKHIIVILIFTFLLFLVYEIYKYANNCEINKVKTLSLVEFLSDNSISKYDNINFNKYGEVTQNNKVILNSSGEPLTEKSANTTVEMKIISALNRNINANCDESDTKNNGTFGCYIDLFQDNVINNNMISKSKNNSYDLSKNPIDIYQEKCYSFSYVYKFPACGYDAANKWHNEIKIYLYKLKKVMNKDEYNQILKNQKQWEIYVQDTEKIIQRYIISDNESVYNSTSASRNIALIQKQRALLLMNIYHHYYERKE